MAKKYYVVKKGLVPGIYLSWPECKKNIDGYSGAVYKGFMTLEEAEAYMNGNGNGGVSGCTSNHTRDYANAYNEKAEDISPMCLKNGGESADKDYANAYTREPECVDGDEKMIAPEKVTGDRAVAYVDGSYNIATGEYSYGAVIFHNGQEEHFSEKFDNPERATMRNVAGEIEGSMCAMKYCLEHGIGNLDIYFDYEGIEKWCTGDWKANKEGTIAYRDFYHKAREQVKIRFVKVKGHSGDKYNDLADKLAKEAVGV